MDKLVIHDKIEKVGIDGLSIISKELYYDGDVAGWCNIDFDNNFTPLAFTEKIYFSDENGYHILEDIIIPEGVTEIQNYQFAFCVYKHQTENCQKINKIVIPEGVTKIYDCAFGGITFSNLYLPSTLEYCAGFYLEPGNQSDIFDFNTYYNGTPEDWINVEYCKFDIIFSGNVYFNYDGEYILTTDIELSEGITILDKACFSGYKKLKSIKLPQSLEIIDEFAFNNCCSLEEIIIPKNTKSIEYAAFYDCKSLKNIIFEEGSLCENINNYAFSFCENIEKLVLPFAGNKVYEIEEDVRFELLHSNKNVKEIEILGGNIIPTKAFVGYPNLEKITIHESIIKIGDNAFGGCPKLKEIKILGNSKLESIGVISGVPQLKEFILPATVKKYGGVIYAESLEKVIIPYVDESSDQGISKFKSIFENTNIKHVIITNQLVLPDNAFSYNNTIETVELIKTEVIGKDAFSYCENLKTIVLSENIKDIGIGAFMGSGIEEFKVPDQILEIKDMTFADCKNLVNIDLNNVQIIGSCAFRNSGLISLELPTTVVSIGNEFTCSLDELYINSIIKIENESFINTSIKNLYFNGNIDELNSFFEFNNISDIIYADNIYIKNNQNEYYLYR